VSLAVRCALVHHCRPRLGQGVVQALQTGEGRVPRALPGHPGQTGEGRSASTLTAPSPHCCTDFARLLACELGCRLTRALPIS